MKRLLLGTFVLSSLLYGTVVTRPMLSGVERLFKGSLESLFTPDQLFGMLDSPQGVYIEGFGVVLTARVNLVEAPGLMPFRPALKPEEIKSIRDRKIERLPIVRDAMRHSMMLAAGMIETVPMDEQFVYSVVLFHHTYEDAKGIPTQIVMQASRKALLALQRQPDKAALATAIKMREF